MKNKFSYNDYRKKQDYFILKYPKKIGWVCAGKESLITKCYMLFRIIRLKEFQTKCLTLFIEKINRGLNNISDITNASGAIKVNVSFPDYQSEWQKYMNGEISSKMLEDSIFPKFVNRKPNSKKASICVMQNETLNIFTSNNGQIKNRANKNDEV